MKPASESIRFTARGGARVEAEVRAMVARAAKVVSAAIPPAHYRSMILHGGYGHGEGGIERVGGVERPHNNLDFLLITTLACPSGAPKMKRLLDDLFRPIAREHGVGIDTGVINEWKLRASPCLVMWYDMRWGHKPVLGDASFVRSLTRFRRDRIEPWDMRDLLVNRGSLLVINDMILARGPSSQAERRFLVKHAMKAIIGYGDAHLFATGAYDWSYRERQRRMQQDSSAPASFRALYNEAMEFRFEPSYERYLNRDLAAWMSQLREELMPIHLAFERFRLGDPSLTFRDYGEKALREALFGSPLAPLAYLRKAKNLVLSLRRGAPDSSGGLLREIAARCNSARGNRSIAFPAVLYGEGGDELAELARVLLGARSSSRDELRRAYLEGWGLTGDTNFSTTARALDLPLSHAEQRA